MEQMLLNLSAEPLKVCAADAYWNYSNAMQEQAHFPPPVFLPGAFLPSSVTENRFSFFIHIQALC